MIRINLLPFRAARTKENVRRQVSVFILLIVLLLVGMGAFKLYLNNVENEEKSKTEAIKAELKKYTAKAKEVDRLEAENNMLQKKIDIINDLEKLRKEPVLIFDALNDLIVEERMWLNSFNIKGQNIDIRGIALDEITVADFTKRLQTSDYFTNVVLKFLKQNVKQNIKMKEFQINAQIAQIETNKNDISKALK